MAPPGLVAWVDSVHTSELYLSVVTVLEVELGALLKGRKDPAQGAALQQWIHANVLPTFDGRILPITTEIARRCAALHVPDPRPQRDAMIAATALVHGMTVVTGNVADFKPIGVKLINPCT